MRLVTDFDLMLLLLVGCVIGGILGYMLASLGVRHAKRHASEILRRTQRALATARAELELMEHAAGDKQGAVLGTICAPDCLCDRCAGEKLRVLRHMRERRKARMPQPTEAQDGAPA